MQLCLNQFKLLNLFHRKQKQPKKNKTQTVVDQVFIQRSGINTSIYVPLNLNLLEVFQIWETQLIVNDNIQCQSMNLIDVQLIKCFGCEERFISETHVNIRKKIRIHKKKLTSHKLGDRKGICLPRNNKEIKSLKQFSIGFPPLCFHGR